MDVDCIEDRTAKLEKLEQGVAESERNMVSDTFGV